MPAYNSSAFISETLNSIGKQTYQNWELVIADDGFVFSNKEIIATPRIGVDYAGKDALLPYRFYIKGNPFVSGRLKM